jgi:hypothetical protein
VSDLQGDPPAVGPGLVAFQTEEEVLDGSPFKFRPQWWEPRVPESWGSWLTSLPADPNGRGYHLITRRDMLTLPDCPDRDGRLLVACYVWGTGEGGWLAGRRARVFRATARDELLTRLGEARRMLRTEGPVAAYSAFSDGGPLRTRYMRASFFTKFLYAADPPGDGSVGRALILDQFVAIALNDLHGWNLHEKGGWSADTYQRWIELARDEAARNSHAGLTIRADAVEKAYFNHGRELARQRRTARKRTR